jgi:hypothetical protein
MASVVEGSDGKWQQSLKQMLSVRAVSGFKHTPLPKYLSFYWADSGNSSHSHLGNTQFESRFETGYAGYGFAQSF